MAFIFTDTFCTITSSAQSPYDAVTGTVTYNSTYARFTPPSGCIGGGVFIGNNSSLRKNLPSTSTSAIAFLSYGHSGSLTNGQRIISFWNSGTEVAALVTTAAGAVQFTIANSNIGSASASGLILANQSLPIAGIEIQLLPGAGGTGTANCWINGTQVLTQNASVTTGTLSYNQLQIGDATGGQAAMYTDYVRLWDSTTSTQNTPIGLDRQPITKVPSGVGSSGPNWTPNGFANNWQCVSVIPPNGSDYVSAAGTNVIESYAMPSAGLIQAPTQVVLTSYFEKDDGATRTYRLATLQAGNVVLGSQTFTANSSYTWVQSCIPFTGPTASTPWTGPTADAAQFWHAEVT